MELLVLSDSHGDFQSLETLIKRHWDIDTIVHLGDGTEEIWQISQLYPHKTYYYVTGNNDDDRDAPEELLLEVDGVKIYLTHGHIFSLRKRKENMAFRAKELGAVVAFFGHTHVFSQEEVDGVLLINPGAVKFGRDKANRYCIVTVNRDGTIVVEKRLVRED